MKYKKRKTRKNVKKQKKILIISIITISLLLTLSYASFQTNINLNVTGKTKIMYSANTIKKLSKSNSLTMFTDPFGNIRYTGSNNNVHNYICLIDETPCQDKHLFRIIGSFINIDDGNGKKETRVKIVKANEFSKSHRDDSNSNNWAKPSTLNTTLNTTFYDNLDNDAQDIIGEAVWNLGSGASSDYSATEIYSVERRNNFNEGSPSTWTGIFALFYPSDYAYASYNCKDIEKILYYNNDTCKSTNWLYGNQSDKTQYNEWLLTPDHSHNDRVYAVNNIAAIGYSNSVLNSFTSRPSAFLKSNTLLITENHDGTLLNPYVVKLYEEE